VRLVTDFVSGDNRQREPPPFVIIIVVTVPPFDEDMMRIDHLGAIVRTAGNRLRGRHGAAVVDSRVVDGDERHPVARRRLIFAAHLDVINRRPALVRHGHERRRRRGCAVAVGTGERNLVLAKTKRSGRQHGQRERIAGVGIERAVVQIGGAYRGSTSVASGERGIPRDNDGPVIDQVGGGQVVERAAKVITVPVRALGNFWGVGAIEVVGRQSRRRLPGSPAKPCANGSGRRIPSSTSTIP